MDELVFHYIKSPDHREIKVDGAIGGASPAGRNLSLSVFCERVPIPRTVVHRVQSVDGESGVLGEEIVERREGREGVVRVVQATLHMDVANAKAIYEWIGKQLEILERRPTDGAS